MSEWTAGRSEGRREGRAGGRMRAGWQPTKLEPHTEMWGKIQNFTHHGGGLTRPDSFVCLFFAFLELSKEPKNQKTSHTMEEVSIGLIVLDF